MKYKRMPIEVESPEQIGYGKIACNLAESSVHDALVGELGLDLTGLVLCYGDHLGKPELRDLLAAESPGLSRDDVLLTAGAAAALFIVATSLLQPGDRLLVVHPNYATNLETPRAIGAQIDFLRLRFEDGFRLDLAEVERQLLPGTRLISVTHPHNPTGTTIPEADLRALADLAERRGCYLLVDETYRDLLFEPPCPLAAAISQRAISVSSVSKACGLPGIRLGWLITRDPALQELFLAAKEQIFICNSVVDEEIAHQFLSRRDRFMPAIRARIHTNLAAIHEWIRGERRMEWVEPRGGVVCFPRVRGSVPFDADAFYRILFERYQTMVGPGHWFEMDDRYMRIGFGWPDEPQLRRGLACISHTLDELA